MIDEIDLLLAGSQLTGYAHARAGGDLLGLVRLMGLRLDEWQWLKHHDSNLYLDLRPAEIALIDAHFGVNDENPLP